MRFQDHQKRSNTGRVPRARGRGRAGRRRGGQRPDRDKGERLLRCWPAPAHAAQVALSVGKVTERAGEVGPESVGASGGQTAIEADGFFAAGQRPLALPQVALPVGKAIEREGEIGPEGVGASGGQTTCQLPLYLVLARFWCKSESLRNQEVPCLQRDRDGAISFC
jgi:hypothetical protein